MLRYVFGYETWFYGLFLKYANGTSAGWGIAILASLIFATMLISYTLGSVNTAVILSKLMYGEDIRTKGSGNAGMTNMMRTYGKGPAALTLLGDMFKTMLGMIAGTLLLGFNGAYLAGLFCVVGHIFPVFYRFKGGKGVASSAMVLLYINPIAFLIIFAMFALIVWGTKYLSLGSVMCMAIMPLMLHRLDDFIYDRPIRLILSMVMAALVIFMHRSNITRIMNGTESKFKFKKTVKNNTDSKNDDPYLKK